MEKQIGVSDGFEINDQPANAIKYAVRLNGSEIENIDLVFMNGRQKVIEAKGLDRKQAVSLIGEENVKNIEEGKGKDKDAEVEAPKGKLKGKQLAKGVGFTADYEVNSVEHETVIEQTLDEQAIATARANAERRRRESLILRQVNSAVQKESEIGQDQERDEPPAAEEDKDKAVPSSVKSKFVGVEGKYYFPDETLAFEDKGEQLRARAEHREVVSAIVAIAVARDWDKITVRGSEAFRRAVWLEASQRGVEVKGYKPSEVEKAKLAQSLEKRGAQGKSAGLVENVVEKGISREAAQSLDSISHKGDAKAEKLAGAPLRQVAGQMVDRGKAPYDFNDKNEMNYFVRLKTDKGEQVVWGKDLERALADSEAKLGEQVTLNYMGNQPVTVKARQYDAQGKFIGTKDVDTHRNTWNVERADAFRNQDRSEAVAKHPELAGAFAQVAGAKAFAKEKLSHLSAEDRAKFVDKTKEKIAAEIEAGKEIKTPKVLTRQAKQREEEQARKPREKTRTEELTR